jgi:hypothetical protein
MSISYTQCALQVKDKNILFVTKLRQLGEIRVFYQFFRDLQNTNTKNLPYNECMTGPRYWENSIVPYFLDLLYIFLLFNKFSVSPAIKPKTNRMEEHYNTGQTGELEFCCNFLFLLGNRQESPDS